MKLMKLRSFLMLFVVFCCTSYANENKYIFVGQNGNGESAKIAFLLEVSAEDLKNAFMMNENGEIFLKADKVVAIPKETLANFALTANFDSTNFVEGGRRDPQEIKCPDCWQYYTPQPGKGCPNPHCPSNR